MDPIQTLAEHQNDTVLSQIWNHLLEHIAIYFQGN